MHRDIDIETTILLLLTFACILITAGLRIKGGF